MHGSKGIVSRVQVFDTRLLSHIYPKPPDDPQNEKGSSKHGRVVGGFGA